MFTGLITEIGTVKSFDRSSEGARIKIAASQSAPQVNTGDSVAVNGVCLTSVEADGEEFSFEAMNQTLSASSIGALSVGDKVNLELPLTATDRLGGHFVQGHVDGVGKVKSIEADGFASRMQIAVDTEVMTYLADKGSIAVNGVSLTVSGLDSQSFEVSLIPETMTRTNLGYLEPGDQVNIETDILAKYVSGLLTRSQKVGRLS